VEHTTTATRLCPGGQAAMGTTCQAASDCQVEGSTMGEVYPNNQGSQVGLAVKYVFFSHLLSLILST